MVRSKRNLLAAAETSSSPPNALPEGHEIARVVKAAGNNLYEVENGLGGKTLVEMHSRLRSTIWVKRGSFVVVDRHSLALRDNKLGGEIVNVVSNEKAWRRESYWPKEFAKQSTVADGDESEDESVIGKMPPAEDESSET